VLDKILHSNFAMPDNDKLIVGNNSKDDAAVYDLGNGTALISTTDFFMPIVDDPFLFGRIASANAISDVYAMGGKPILAIAILGWPIAQLSPEVAKRVIQVSRSICKEAGIPHAGGHRLAQCALAQCVLAQCVLAQCVLAQCVLAQCVLCVPCRACRAPIMGTG